MGRGKPPAAAPAGLSALGTAWAGPVALPQPPGCVQQCVSGLANCDYPTKLCFVRNFLTGFTSE